VVRPVIDPSRERRVELLLSRRVVDLHGRVVGRIYEMRAEKEGDHSVVTEIDLGPAALLERLAVHHFGVSWRGRPLGYRVRWDQIDLEDQRHPRLLCERSELQAIAPPKRTARSPKRPASGPGKR
jgi:hypothetical protein